MPFFIHITERETPPCPTCGATDILTWDCNDESPNGCGTRRLEDADLPEDEVKTED